MIYFFDIILQRLRRKKTWYINVRTARQLSDESTQRLEPYDTKAMRPFESGYLSGFYADCFDTDQNKLQYIARQRSKELFDKEVEKSINDEDIEILKSSPKSEILKSSYAMFPAWFMTFRY